jgi:hypothetical protein
VISITFATLIVASCVGGRLDSPTRARLRASTAGSSRDHRVPRR